MKILQIFGEPIANGGEESFVMNMYECIDKKRLQFDLFTPYYCENVNTKKKIESYGGKVIVRNKRFNSKLRKLYFMRELKKFLDTNKYDVVHINSGSTIMLASGARIAKKSGVKKVIVHSHCASKINSVKFFSYIILMNIWLALRLQLNVNFLKVYVSKKSIKL